MNEDDDFDDDLELDDTGFDEFDDDDSDNDGGTTLGDLWRNNALFKIAVVAGGIILLIFILMQLGKSDKDVAISNVPAGPDVKAEAGEEGASQAYVEAVVDENTNRFEEALKTGGSAIPTPIDARDAVLSLGTGENDEEDPLDRWRRLQEQRQVQAEAIAIPTQPQETPEQAAARQQSIEALASLMAEQMGTILETATQTQVNSLTFTDPSYLEELAAQEENAVIAVTDAAGGGAVIEAAGITLVPAGEIEYAQLITQANSDVPGPVLAQIAGGPLSGARVIGSFNVQKELLTLNFNKIVIDDVTYPISAVALDPATTLPGVATDVDHHYFQRIVLPAAAAFVEGMTGAIANSGRTTITVTGETVTSSQTDANNDQEVASGVEELGEELGEILDDIADDLETTVVVASGTPLGLFFTEPVVVPETAFE